MTHRLFVLAAAVGVAALSVWVARRVAGQILTLASLPAQEDR